MAEADDSLMLAILRELRAEMRQQRTLLLQLTEAVHRLERRISDTRAEIELMLKAELLGSLTHFETQMDERIARLEDRVSALERPHS
jgi:hypothetical protein